jgi:hypothetical protein
VFVPHVRPDSAPEAAWRHRRPPSPS